MQSRIQVCSRTEIHISDVEAGCENLALDRVTLLRSSAYISCSNRMGMFEMALHELRKETAEALGLKAVLLSSPSQGALAEIWDGLSIKKHYYGSQTYFAHPHPDIEPRVTPSDEGKHYADFAISL